MSSIVKTSIKKIFDIIFPNRCPSCRQFNSDGYFCYDCWKKLKFIIKSCDICGKPITIGGKSAHLCITCPERNQYYDKIASVFVYNKTIARAIFEFKYHEKTFLCKMFAKILLLAFGKIKMSISSPEQNIDFIVPIPLHIKKLRKRGYNQSLLLVKEFSRLVNIPYIPDLIVKVVNTISQTKLSNSNRKTNLKSSFCFNEKYLEKIKGKNILLIDDVITTSSTINECSKILKKNGINLVYAISIARGGVIK